MDPWFGEFQYAYSCTRELEDGNVYFPAWGPPFLPTLVQEGKVGYDVAFFGAPICPVFLQFKVSDYLHRANATEFHHFNRPYFRFYVYPDSHTHQHNRLVALAHDEEEVYYCAPEFAQESDYTSYHASRSVSAHSVFIECGQLPHITGGAWHRVVYAPGASKGFFHSGEARPISPIHGLEDLLRDVRGRPNRFDPTTMVLERLSQMLDLRLNSSDSLDRGFRDFRQAAVTLSAGALAQYGLVLGFVRQKPISA